MNFSIVNTFQRNPNNPVYNASSIQSIPIDTTGIEDGDTLLYDSVNQLWTIGQGGTSGSTGPTGPTGSTGPSTIPTSSSSSVGIASTDDSTVGIFASSGAVGITWKNLSNLTATYVTGFTPIILSWNTVVNPGSLMEAITWSPELTLFVVVVDTGNFDQNLYSSNGVDWMTATNPDGYYYDVKWSPQMSKFIAVGDSGVVDKNIIQSSDGISWTTTGSGIPFAEGFYSLAYSAELTRFVALGFNGNIIYSVNSDATQWLTSSLVGSPINFDWNGIVWSPQLTLFVAVNNGGSVNNQTQTSSNGISWISHAGANVVEMRSIEWSAEYGIFVVGTSNNDIFLTGTNGIDWTSHTIPYQNHTWTSIQWAPETTRFIAVSSQSATIQSEDGETWTDLPSASASAWRSITYSPELNTFITVSPTNSGDPNNVDVMKTSSTGGDTTQHVVDVNVDNTLAMRVSTSGIIPPNLTTTQRNDIVEPTQGLIIYNVTTTSLNYYNGTNWISF